VRLSGGCGGCHLAAVRVVWRQWRLPSGGCVRLSGGCGGYLAAVAVAVVTGAGWGRGWGGLLDALERESGVRMRGLGGDLRTEDDLE
jgi:hypothetical protein